MLLSPLSVSSYKRSCEVYASPIPNIIKSSHKFDRCLCTLNCFIASGDFCHLLINFSNSLDSDQDRHNVGLIWIQTV